MRHCKKIQSLPSIEIKFNPYSGDEETQTSKLKGKQDVKLT